MSGIPKASGRAGTRTTCQNQELLSRAQKSPEEPAVLVHVDILHDQDTYIAFTKAISLAQAQYIHNIDQVSSSIFVNAMP